MNLLPLFLVSLAAVGYETALTRYFAVAKWSEYGYWVISIVMVGFALSGVVLALFRDAFARRTEGLLAALPAALVVTAAAGFWCTAANPFNPLQLQNLATWQPQLWNIAGYYAALLPFFFLAGLFISLNFVLHAHRIGVVYGADLTGAGAGAASVLLAMYLVDAFDLVSLLLLPLAAAAPFCAPRWRIKATAAAVLALLGGEAVLLHDNPASFNDFKAIYAPLHTPDARVAAHVRSPRGDYLLLDDFTERVDTDISNNAGMLGIAGPPETFGLYRDGNRIAALPKPGPVDVRYAGAALDALPYSLIPHARVLLAGASGGFRVAEARALGAIKVEVLEPEPVLNAALRSGLGPSPPLPPEPAVALAHEAPVAATRHGVYDILDISADFLDGAETNVSAFSAEAIGLYVRQMAPGGIVSIPVSIRDFPVYALRMLATVRSALLDTGIANPAEHVVVYRSAWSVRILVARDGWSPAQIATVRKFCDDRSFDVSWYPHMDVHAARAGIYNDLPAVSFEKGEVQSADGPDDAIADEAEAVLTGLPTQSATSFNLSPITLDRPFFYAVLRLDQLSETPGNPAAGGGRRAGQPRGPGPGRGHRDPGAAGAPGRATPDPCRRWRPAARRRLLPGPGAGVPVHRDLPDRAGELLAQRPDQRFRPGADRHAGVFRPGQPALGPLRRRPARGCGPDLPGGDRLGRGLLRRVAAADRGDPGLALDGARRDAARRHRAGLAGLGAAVPAGAEPGRR